MNSSFVELVNERGERIVVIRSLWERLIQETNAVGNLRGLDDPLTVQAGSGYPKIALDALLEQIRVRAKHGPAEIHPWPDEYQKALDKWRPFLAGSKEVLLHGHDYLDVHRHQQPDDRPVSVSNRKGTVEMPFAVWRSLLEMCLRANWQPSGTSFSEGETWPATWGGWYLLPGFRGLPAAIGAKEAELLGRLLSGEVLRQVISDVNMTACGPDLDRLLRLRMLLHHDSVSIVFK